MPPGEQFGWSVSEGGVVVVRPPIELDLSNADHLRECCLAAIDTAGPRVVVDLAGTRFLDSAALSALVQVAHQVQTKGGWLRLARGDSSMVRKVLEITRMDTFLGNYPSVEKATEA